MARSRISIGGSVSLGVGISASAYDRIAGLRSEAAFFIDAANPAYSGGQTVPNLGYGGTALDATMGSGTAVDSNDPVWLAYSGTPYVYLPGANSNRLTVNDIAAYGVTNLDACIRVALDDWTPTALGVVAGQNGGAGNIGWDLRVLSDGKLRLRYTTDGTTAIQKDSTASPTVTDGSALWLRYTMDSSNGDVKFYTAADQSAEPSSWTQLGTTVSGSAGAVFNSTAVVEVGATNNTTGLAGKYYRFILKSGIGGSTVLDIDTSVLTSGASTSFTESSSNAATVTIGRGTAGRKTAVVCTNKWLLGTDDYLEVANSALLNFAVTDSFTAIAIVRQWATPTSSGRYIDKASATATDGWGLSSNTTAIQPAAFVDSPASTGTAANGSVVSSGTLALFGIQHDGVGKLVKAITNTTISSGSSTAAHDTFTNSGTMRIGRAGGAGTAYQDFSLYAAGVWRRALTSDEISALYTYFTTKIA